MIGEEQKKIGQGRKRISIQDKQTDTKKKVNTERTIGNVFVRKQTPNTTHSPLEVRVLYESVWIDLSPIQTSRSKLNVREK